MKPQKEIVTLILSLTAREKRYFKKNYGSENEFVKLFDYIIKYKSFSVPEFNEYLAKSEGRTELYTSGYISTIRQYLRDKLLSSLRKVHRNSSPTMELWNDLGVSQILMNKGLINIAKSELAPSIKAKDRLFPLESLTLLQQQSIFQFVKGYKDSTEASINALYDERKENVKQHLIEVELARTISLLSYFLQKNIYDKEKIKSIEASKVLKADYQSLCFTNKYLFDWAYAQLFLLKSDVNKAFTRFYKVVYHWLINPEMIRSYPDIFIGVSHYYLRFTQYKYLGEFKESELQSIDEILIFYRKTVTNLGLSKRTEKFISYFELTLYVIQNEFSKVVERAPIISELISGSNEISQFSKNYMSFLIGYSAFREKEFDLCLKETEAIIFNKENISESPLYFSKATLLYLMCHFSAGNEFFVKNEYKKKKRSLAKAGLLSEYEKLFFSFLHNFYLKRNSDKKPTIVEEYKSEFEELGKDAYFGSSYREMPIFEWFERILEAEKVKV